jgi:hypothetical protein
MNFKLKLLKAMQIYPIFHITLLKKAPQNTKQQKTEVENKNKYKIEQILNQDQINSQTKYLVK